MIALHQDLIVWVFLFFCRIGTCLMIIPGFSTQRIPVRVRLFIAIAVTLTLSPVLLEVVANKTPELTISGLTTMIILESVKGAVIGLVGQMFMLSLQFVASAMAMFIGMGGLPGSPVEGTEPIPSVATLLTLTATTLIFLTDLHWEVLKALLASYEVLPVGEVVLANVYLDKIVTKLSEAMFLGVQAISPFLIYGVVINFSVGLMNKLTPQVPIYFISLPFILIGGLLLFVFVSHDVLSVFMDGFRQWLEEG